MDRSARQLRLRCYRGEPLGRFRRDAEFRQRCVRYWTTVRQVIGRCSSLAGTLLYNERVRNNFISYSGQQQKCPGFRRTLPLGACEDTVSYA